MDPTKRNNKGDETMTPCGLKTYTDQEVTRILARRTDTETYECDLCGELHLIGPDTDYSSVSAGTVEEIRP